MLLQSANEFGLQLPNAALGLATQQQAQKQPTAPSNFYSERNAESNKTVQKTKEDFTKDVGEDDILDEVYNIIYEFITITNIIYVRICIYNKFY